MARRGVALLLITLAACGGGGNPAGPTFLVDTAPAPGVTFSPGSRMVEQGGTASFSVSFRAGYGPGVLQGCGGSLVGNTYTTAAIVAPCTVSGTTKATYALSAIRLRPNALFHDEFATAPVTIEAVTSGAQGLRLTAEFFSNTFALSAPSGMARMALFDDGTHGDRIAGDGIHTATFATGLTPILRYFDRTADQLPIRIVATDEFGNQMASVHPYFANSLVNLGVVHRSMAVATVPVGGGMVAAPNALNVVLPDPSNRGGEAAQKMYQAYADVFDGFVIAYVGVTSGTNIPGGGYARNDVQGINVPLFNNSSGYGSSGRLRSSVFLSYDILGETFLHEFGHAMMFYLSDPALDLTRGDLHHAALSTARGQMDANSYWLVEQPDGNFRVEIGSFSDQAGRIYSDLELYLMGLLPPELVRSQQYVLDASVLVNAGVAIPRARTVRVGIEDVVRVYGPRVPSASESQKSFRIAFIALTETPATPAEIALVNRVAAYFAGASSGEQDSSGLFTVVTPRSFFSATRGLGEMVTRLPSPK